MECKEVANGTCLINQYCSSSWASIISSKKNRVLYKKGQRIINEGTTVFGVFLVCDGKVKVVAKSNGNREHIVRLATNGHFLGRMGSGNDTYPFNAEALEDSWICFVDNETLFDALMANPKLSFHLMMFYAKELRNVETRMKNLSLMNVREKVAETLLYLMKIFGLTQDSLLNVSLGRKDIASLAGTSSNQVIEQLSQFEEEKIIKKQGKQIQILKERELNGIVAHY